MLECQCPACVMMRDLARFEMLCRFAETIRMAPVAFMMIAWSGNLSSNTRAHVADVEQSTPVWSVRE